LTGEPVAIKILEKSRIIDVSDVERVTREIHILKLIRHPNIVQLYEIIETPKHLFLVMEFVMHGELFDYIVERQRYPDANLDSKKPKPANYFSNSSLESNIFIS
jgi:5'-AMP-activated protein kinase catalytic alpha subunit